MPSRNTDLIQPKGSVQCFHLIQNRWYLLLKKLKDIFFLEMVGSRRLELPPLTRLVPKSSVSTIPPRPHNCNMLHNLQHICNKFLQVNGIEKSSLNLTARWCVYNLSLLIMQLILILLSANYWYDISNKKLY